MGFFSSLAELTAIGHRSYADFDVRAQLAGAQAQLDAMNASMGIPASSGALVPAVATIISGTPTGGAVGIDPIVVIEATALIEGGGVQPVRATLPISPIHLARIAPGARLEVLVAPGRPEILTIRW